MRLEPSGLIRQQGVRRGVGLVESVAGEFLHEIENVRRLRLPHAARHGAADENGTLLRHLFRLLFAHGAAQEISAAERVARENLRNLHDLLLVQDHAVGCLQNGLQIRVQVIDGRTGGIVLARDEILDHAGLQRAGPKQRHERHDVAESIGLQPPNQVFHAA